MRRWSRWMLVVGLAVAAAILWQSGSEAPDADEPAPASTSGGSPALSGSRAETSSSAPAVAPAPAAPPAQNSGRILGTVRRGGDPARARVEVHLVGSGDALLAFALRPGAPVVRTEADEGGRFEADGLAPGRYRVSAFDGGDAAEDLVELFAEGERVAVELHLALRGESLVGRVVHVDGRPWTGRVAVAPASFFDDGARSVPVVVATDADGRFTAAGLPPDVFEVVAFAEDGTEVAGGLVGLPTRETFTLTIDAGTLEASGRVVRAEGGAPVPGADVAGSIGRPGVERRAFRTTTDAQGAFRVRVPFSGGLVTVRAAGFTQVSRPFDGTQGELEFRLARGARVHGRVTSAADGSPIPGVLVGLNPARKESGRSWTIGDRDVTTRTGPDGRYEFASLAAGTYLVLARGGGRVAEGYLTPSGASGPGVVSVAAGGEAVVDLRMVAGARIVGTVVDSGGRPVAGARVFVSARPGSRDVTEGFDAWSAYSHDDPVVTGVDGAFRVEGLVPGISYEVTVRAAGEAPPPPLRVMTREGEEVRADFRLPVPRWLEVTVLDEASGEAVAHATVSVAIVPPARPADKDDLLADFHASRSTDQRAVTNRAGFARVGPLGAGLIKVSADAHGYVRRDDPVEVEGSEGPSAVLTASVRLRRGRSIAGRVVRPDGTPAAGAAVTLQSAGGDRSWFTSTGADEAGAFDFTGLGEGEYRVTAAVPREEHVAEAVVRAGDAAVELRLGAPTPDPRQLVVRVLDPEGRPVPSASARFTSGSGGHGRPVREGVVVFEPRDDVPAAGEEGVLEIEDARDHADARLPVGRLLREGIRWGQNLEVRLPPERAIEGRVVGPGGAGVANARVRAQPVAPGQEGYVPQDDRTDWQGANSVVTDSAGRFRLGHLGEGPHDLFVLPPPEFAPPGSARAEAGEIGITIDVRSAFVATLSVLDPEGKPVPQARVAVARVIPGSRDPVANLFSGHGTMEVTGDDAGRARIPTLDASARYVLGVRGPESRSDLARFANASWSPADETIRLARGLSITGTVKDPSGAALAGVDVVYVDEIGVFASTATAEDGTFRITGFAAGSHLVLQARVFVSDGSRNSPGTTVVAGARDVVLVVP